MFCKSNLQSITHASSSSFSTVYIALEIFSSKIASNAIIKINKATNKCIAVIEKANFDTTT